MGAIQILSNFYAMMRRVKENCGRQQRQAFLTDPMNDLKSSLNNMSKYYNLFINAPCRPLRELQSASGEELPALMPCVLNKAFKGEL